jgi:hypothetical protein
MEDAHNHYDYEANIIGENLHRRNGKIDSSGCRNKETPPNIVETMKILRVELQHCRVDNERLIKAQE